MDTGNGTTAQYFTLFVMLGDLAGLTKDDMIEMVMGILQEPPAVQRATYRAWIDEIVMSLRAQPPATGPEGEG